MLSKSAESVGRTMFEETAGMFPELVTRSDLEACAALHGRGRSMRCALDPSSTREDALSALGGRTGVLATNRRADRLHLRQRRGPAGHVKDARVPCGARTSCRAVPCRMRCVELCTRGSGHELRANLMSLHGRIGAHTVQHDECNGSDVFGSDICTCRPYLAHGIEGCVKAAQNGGVGLVVYCRKEARTDTSRCMLRVGPTALTSAPVVASVCRGGHLAR